MSYPPGSTKDPRASEREGPRGARRPAAGAGRRAAAVVDGARAGAHRRGAPGADAGRVQHVAPVVPAVAGAVGEERGPSAVGGAVDRAGTGGGDPDLRPVGLAGGRPVEVDGAQRVTELVLDVRALDGVGAAVAAGAVRVLSVVGGRTGRQGREDDCRGGGGRRCRRGDCSGLHLLVLPRVRDPAGGTSGRDHQVARTYERGETPDRGG